MTTPFEAAFKAELMAAVQRRHAQRRRHRNMLRAGAGAVAAAIAAGLGALLGSPAAAEVEVRLADGVVEVVLHGDVTTANEVTEALREHGVDASVDAVPSGPSMVGRFVRVAVSGDVDAVIRFGGDQGAYTSFTVDEPGGTIVISIGRAAEPGEPYDSPASAFARREPLHCAGVYGRMLEDVPQEVGGFESVRVVALDGELRRPDVPLPDAIGVYGSWHVVEAAVLSAEDLRLTVAETAPGPEPGC